MCREEGNKMTSPHNETGADREGPLAEEDRLEVT